MIRVLLFDLDGTLIDRAAAHRRYGLDLLARRPDLFAGVDRAEALRRLAGAPGRDRFAFARRAAASFPGLGTPAEIAADYARRIASFLEPDPALLRLLDGLRTRFALGVVSNGAAALQRAKLDAAGLSGLVGHAVFSGEQRAAKPHAPLFRRALAWAQADPAEVLFVGDDPAADIAGAARAGLKTCWVAGGRAYPAGVVPPDLTVPSVHALAEALP